MNILTGKMLKATMVLTLALLLLMFTAFGGISTAFAQDEGPPPSIGDVVFDDDDDEPPALVVVTPTPTPTVTPPPPTTTPISPVVTSPTPPLPSTGPGMVAYPIAMGIVTTLSFLRRRESND